jgi:hypothetical protein
MLKKLELVNMIIMSEMYNGGIWVKVVFKKFKPTIVVLGIVVLGALVIWGLISLKGLIINAK